MLKHRGFPGRLPGTDFQFTIRRANPKGVSKLFARERYRDRSPADRRADAPVYLGTYAFAHGAYRCVVARQQRGGDRHPPRQSCAVRRAGD